VETTDDVTLDGSIESAMSRLIEPQQEEVEIEESETAEVEDEVEDEPEADEEEDQDEEFEEDDSDVEEGVEEQPQTYTVKVDGTEIEVTLDELTRGYSGQKYIQKGMQEVADARKLAEDVNAKLETARQANEALYQQMQTPGFAQPPAEPDEALLDTDPFRYQAENNRYQKELQKYNQEIALMQQTTAYTQQAQQEAQRAYVQQEMETLRQVDPDFADPQRATVARDQIVRAGTEIYGYSAEEISAVMDHRAIRVLRDAARYRDLMANKETVVKKAKPKATRVVKAGAKKTRSNVTEVRNQRSKLKRSGRIEDAMSLLLKGD